MQRHTARATVSHDEGGTAPADALDAFAHGVLIVDANARILFDVSGETRRGLDVPDRLRMVGQNRHENLDDDALPLG